MSLFLAALFYVLTPGVYLRLPRNGSKTRVALTHALVFALIYYLTNKVLLNYFYVREGFYAAPKDVKQEVQQNKFGVVGPAKGPSAADKAKSKLELETKAKKAGEDAEKDAIAKGLSPARAKAAAAAASAAVIAAGR